MCGGYCESTIHGRINGWQTFLTIPPVSRISTRKRPVEANRENKMKYTNDTNMSLRLFKKPVSWITVLSYADWTFKLSFLDVCGLFKSAFAVIPPPLLLLPPPPHHHEHHNWSTPTRSDEPSQCLCRRRTSIVLHTKYYSKINWKSNKGDSYNSKLQHHPWNTLRLFHWDICTNELWM